MSLVLDHVGYRYAGSADPVLEDISLTLTPGRVVGVAGRSESGKSTLCLVASGLAPAVIGGVVSGVIRLDERPTAGMKPYELATACGILFQNPVTQLSGTTRTVWEEIAFGPRNLGLEIDELVRRVEETAQALSIHGILARDPGRLSGGQAQLVALASVLAIRPRFIVLDEPTSQLDPIGTKLVAQALAGLTRSRDVGILVVEQKPELLAELADELIVLEGGRIAASGRIADIQGDPGIGAFGIEPPASIRIRRAAEAAGRPIDSAVIG